MEVILGAVKMVATRFADWIDENGWVKDPFPRKEFNDDKIRYTNIATIDHHSDDKLVMYTTDELYEVFILSERERLEVLKT